MSLDKETARVEHPRHLNAGLVETEATMSPEPEMAPMGTEPVPTKRPPMYAEAVITEAAVKTPEAVRATRAAMSE